MCRSSPPTSYFFDPSLPIKADTLSLAPPPKNEAPASENELPLQKKLPLISVLIHKTTLEQVASYSAKMAVLTWSMQNFKRKMKLSKNVLLSYDKLIK